MFPDLNSIPGSELDAYALRLEAQLLQDGMPQDAQEFGGELALQPHILLAYGIARGILAAWGDLPDAVALLRDVEPGCTSGALAELSHAEQRWLQERFAPRQEAVVVGSLPRRTIADGHLSGQVSRQDEEAVVDWDSDSIG